MNGHFQQAFPPPRPARARPLPPPPALPPPPRGLPPPHPRATSVRTIRQPITEMRHRQEILLTIYSEYSLEARRLEIVIETMANHQGIWCEWHMFGARRRLQLKILQRDRAGAILNELNQAIQVAEFQFGVDMARRGVQWPPTRGQGQEGLQELEVRRENDLEPNPMEQGLDDGEHHEDEGQRQTQEQDQEEIEGDDEDEYQDFEEGDLLMEEEDVWYVGPG